jgi:hypothetical protein
MPPRGDDGAGSGVTVGAAGSGMARATGGATGSGFSPGRTTRRFFRST